MCISHSLPLQFPRKDRTGCEMLANRGTLNVDQGAIWGVVPKEASLVGKSVCPLEVLPKLGVILAGGISVGSGYQQSGQGVLIFVLAQRTAPLTRKGAPLLAFGCVFSSSAASGGASGSRVTNLISAWRACSI